MLPMPQRLLCGEWRRGWGSAGRPDAAQPVLISSQRQVVSNTLGQWQTEHLAALANGCRALAARTARSCNRQSG